MFKEAYDKTRGFMSNHQIGTGMAIMAAIVAVGSFARKKLSGAVSGLLDSDGVLDE